MIFEGESRRRSETMDNPFLALFEDGPPAARPVEAVRKAPEDDKSEEVLLTNSFYEAVFAFTLDKTREKSKPHRSGLKLLVLDGVTDGELHL